MTNDSAKPIKTADSDRPTPINDARLAALEELSALDQKLELTYGLTGNPMIKAQPCKAAKTDTTQPRNGTPGEGSEPSEGTSEPVAWWVRGCEYDTGCEYEFVTLLKEQAELAATNGGKAVPLYRSPALTDAEREAVKVARDAYADDDGNAECEEIAAVLSRLLERTK